jgi:alkylhydroperoxidase family enzyme
MPRIPYADLTKVPAHIRKSVEAGPYNVTRMLAGLPPDLYDGFSAFAGALISNKSKLPADLREIGILRAGYVAKAKYETWQHEALARHVGLNDEQIAAVKAGGKQPGVLSDVQQAALDFADDLIHNVRVSDANLAAMRKHLPDPLVLELLVATGTYMLISRFLETTGVEFDDKPIDWAAREKTA